MSSIWEGTFVLGDTSATQLSAGPGIALDTSVAGTIGIKTDETVLFDCGSTEVGASSFTYSEPTSAFERVKWLVQPDGGVLSNFAAWWETPGNTINVRPIVGAGGSNAWFDIIFIQNNIDSGSVTGVKRLNFGSITSTSTAINATITGTNLVYKVIGINRKEA